MVIEGGVESRVESIPQKVESETQLIVVLDLFDG